MLYIIGISPDFKVQNRVQVRPWLLEILSTQVACTMKRLSCKIISASFKFCVSSLDIHLACLLGIGQYMKFVLKSVWLAERLYVGKVVSRFSLVCQWWETVSLKS